MLAKPGGENVIINMEGLNFGWPQYTQTDSMIDLGIGQLIAWLRMMRRLSKPGARIALDVPLPIWDLGLIGQHARPATEDLWRKIRYLCARFKADVIPLVDAVCVQSYYGIRWNDPTKDLFGDGPVCGNFNVWQTHACALAALTDKPAIALFSPSIASLAPNIPPRALTDWECGQAMFYLSTFGYSEICFWGTVEGEKLGGMNKWDQKAPWLKTLGQYWDGKTGEFVADPAWRYS